MVLGHTLTTNMFQWNNFLFCPQVISLDTGEALGPNQQGEVCTKGNQAMLGNFNCQNISYFIAFFVFNNITLFNNFILSFL